MPQIIAYHAKFNIEGTNQAIQADMDDWYDTETILQKLSRAYRCKTVGQLISKITNPRIQSAVPGLLKAQIVPKTADNITLRKSDALA
jgi:hypothetical protein